MTNDTTTSKRPTHIAYTVSDYTTNGERKSDWTAIGVAWAHHDDNGHDVVLKAHPVDGRLVLRRRKARPAQAKRD